MGRRNVIGAKEGRRRAHGVKQSCSGGSEDVFGVDPATGDVYDPEGNIVGDLGQVKPK